MHIYLGESLETYVYLAHNGPVYKIPDVKTFKPLFLLCKTSKATVLQNSLQISEQ
jgi:hypothetical protein